MSGGYSTVGSHEAEPMLERVLLLKQEAFVYKIPAGQIPPDDQTGWKATGWNLDKPDWTGKLKLVSKGTNCTIKLEDRGSMKLYAMVNVDTYPGPMVQTVTDSSRYFIIKPVEGPHVGLGFADRSDSFDLNMALNEHFKSLRVDAEIAKESEEPREQLDLALKEGQTIKVNINIPRKSNRERSRSPATSALRSGGVLPPPSAAAQAAGILPPTANVSANPFGSGQPQAPRLNAPPTRPANPNWIKF